MALKQNAVCAILLCILYTCSLASTNSGAQQKPISVVLKGRVVCGHACSSDLENFLGTSYVLSGAAVAVECNGGLNRKMNAGPVSIEGETDKNGEFKVELPSSIISSILVSSSDDDLDSSLKGYCSATVLRSPQEKCNLPTSITSSSDQLIFTPDGNEIRIFTFPSLSYHPQSKLCSRKDITMSSDHELLQAGRALHEVSTGSSNDMAALLPHGNLPPLPKPKLGFPPLHLPRSPLPKPKLGFPPLHLPRSPLPKPKLGFPPLHLPRSPLPKPKLGFPPLHLPRSPLPKPKLGFPPLHLPHSPLPKPKLGFPPLHLPQFPPQPFRNFLHFHASFPPAGIPFSGSSNHMDAYGNFPPLIPQSKLGFPPLDLPHPPPLPKPMLGFPPLDLPQPPPLPKPMLGFPPLDLPHPLPQPFLNFPPLPASIPPLPARIPIPRPPPFPSAFPHANP